MSRSTAESVDDIYFQYFGSWGPGATIREHYFTTAHYSHTPGSQAIMFFQGSSAIYYADKTAELGLANIFLDGLPPEIVNLTSPTPMYRQPVWAKNFTEGDHQLVIQHPGPVGAVIMIDYITVLTEGGGGTRPLRAGPAASVVSNGALTLNSTDAKMRFSENGWRIETEGLFYSRNRWFTQSTGASVEFEFEGTDVWYFADTNDNHGLVRICVDNNEGEVVSGYSPTPLSQRLIWSKLNLPPGIHKINITHEDDSGKYATLDFFRYMPASAPSGRGSKSSLKPGAIAGIVVGAVSFVLLLLYAFTRPQVRCLRKQPQAKPTTLEQNNKRRLPDSPNLGTASNHSDVKNHLPLESTKPAEVLAHDPTPSAPPLLSNLPGGYNIVNTPAQSYRDGALALMRNNQPPSEPDRGTLLDLNQHSRSAPNLHARLRDVATVVRTQSFPR